MPDDRMTDRTWFARHPVKVAFDLIGCVLRVERGGEVVAGRIVETEAYAGPHDPASHAATRKLSREVMGGPPAHIYTYLSYGTHHMMNIVAHEDGEVGGVLLRGIEPLEGIDVMVERRNGVPLQQIGKGPGNLGQAMGILLEDIRTDILAPGAFSLFHGDPEEGIQAGPRIGISKAVTMPWRFFEHPSRFISSHRKGRTVTRDEVPLLIPPPGVSIE